jgi:hypothetical protein
VQRRINTGDLNDHRKFDSHTLPPYLIEMTAVAKKMRRQKAALRDMHPVFVSSSRRHE